MDGGSSSRADSRSVRTDIQSVEGGLSKTPLVNSQLSLTSRTKSLYTFLAILFQFRPWSTAYFVLVSVATKGLLAARMRMLYRVRPRFVRMEYGRPGSFKGEWNGKREWGRLLKCPSYTHHQFDPVRSLKL